MGEVTPNDTIGHQQTQHTALVLSAVCGTDHLSYLVADSDLNQQAVQHISFDSSYPYFSQPLGYLAETMAADDLLYEDFEEVRFALRGVPFAIANDEMLAQQSLQQILEKHTQIAKGDTLFCDRIQNVGLSVVFACPERLVNELQLYFQNASLSHSISTQMAMAVRSPATDIVIDICVAPGIVEVVIFNEESIAFANHFAWSNAQDVLYFTTAVIQELDHHEKPLFWKLHGEQMNDHMAQELIQGFGVARRLQDKVEQSNGPVVKLLSLSKCAL